MFIIVISEQVRSKRGIGIISEQIGGELSVDNV
jgi:hypothetical protein